MKKLIIFSALLLGGCATQSSYINKTNQNVGSFQGKNIQEVINRIGYYTRSFKNPQGKMIYAWETMSSATTPQITQNVGTGSVNVVGNQAYSYNSGQSYQMGGIPITSYCNAYFTVDENNIIIDWQWRGNGC